MYSKIFSIDSTSTYSNRSIELLKTLQQLSARKEAEEDYHGREEEVDLIKQPTYLFMF